VLPCVWTDSREVVGWVDGWGWVVGGVVGGWEDGRTDGMVAVVGAVCIVCVHVHVRVYDMWWMIVTCLLRLCEHAHAYVSV
jgi:hypothetical protein